MLYLRTTEEPLEMPLCHAAHMMHDVEGYYAGTIYDESLTTVATQDPFQG